MKIKSYILGRHHPQLGQHIGLQAPFDRPAKTISKTGLRQVQAPDLGRATRFAEDSFVEVPRWVEFTGDQEGYRAKYLKVQGEASALSEPDKRALLMRLFGSDVAETNVLFVHQYRQFRRDQLDPLTYQLMDLNLSNLEIHFTVSGIVQKCGTLGVLQRIWNLVRLSEKSKIQVSNSDSPDQVNVRIRGDLFSASLFMGMLTPHQSIGGRTLAPRIFHGIDIGWDFAPHNLVVAAVTERAIDLPLGKYFYTTNIERLGRMRIVDAKISSDANKKAAELKELAHKFMLSL